MKVEELKKILKEVVKEVIQSELKEILLESIRSSKQLPITESNNQKVETLPRPQKQQIITNSVNPVDIRNKYLDILNETQAFNVKGNGDVEQKFVPRGGGELGVGEVDMDQIMGLMNPK